MRQGLAGGEPSRARSLKLADCIGISQRDADVVKTIDETLLCLGVHVELLGDSGAWDLDSEAVQVDGDLGCCIVFNDCPNAVDDWFRQNDRQQSILCAVVAEDVAEAWGNDGIESALLQRPHGVFA